jgi:putative addiction module killer protein
MLELRRTARFDAWLRGLEDLRGRARILVRLDRLAFGHLGDVKALGEGVGELRIDAGPGYRVYFARQGSVIVLLCGGQKQRQARDITLAKKMASELKE